MKRAGDLFVSGLLLVLLAVPMLAVAGLLWWRQGRPILFRQERMGRHGTPFHILKFRTMRAPEPGEALVTSGDSDARVTPSGDALRRRRLDEFPQLWNVLRGDMSLVGPRPEVPRYVNLNDPDWKTALTVRPGITGPDALAFRNEGEELAEAENPENHYQQVILPAKLALQVQYAREHSVAGDVRLLFRTLGALRG